MDNHNTFTTATAMAKRYPCSIAIAVAIWILCMIPVPETPLDGLSFVDKWTHFVMYGTLTGAIWLEHVRAHKGKSSRKRLLIGGILCPVAMGCLVELAQAYLTTCRSGDVFDAVCNALGVLLGAGTGRSLGKILFR
ncbi:MAG: VanZ family protein [Bacteroidales bacterium]|nr:VanZ family protein [Bacteroidales bacterium]MCM1147161.1 VanZ family protein [Bacteroidales bacterium]MCM1205387.1 VanZ family protein [Bacillota bacterium]MCM1509808.1 VanZ family protein [Clostridium sp.]